MEPHKGATLLPKEYKGCKGCRVGWESVKGL